MLRQVSNQVKKYRKVFGSRFTLQLLVAAIPTQFIAPVLASPVSDTMAPWFIDLIASPLNFDVSTGTGSVLVRAHITDNLSGYSRGSVNFYNPTAGTSYFVGLSDYNRVSGTALDGWYENTIQVAQYAAQGTYSVNSGLIYDAANNSIFLSAVDFAPYGAEFKIGQIEVPEPHSVALFLLSALVGGLASRGRLSSAQSMR
jgi:hypothetical protein